MTEYEARSAAGGNAALPRRQASESQKRTGNTRGHTNVSSGAERNTRTETSLHKRRSGLFIQSYQLFLCLRNHGWISSSIGTIREWKTATLAIIQLMASLLKIHRHVLLYTEAVQRCTTCTNMRSRSMLWCSRKPCRYLT